MLNVFEIRMRKKELTMIGWKK